jgi:anaerobic ribonucleoside-triphosphate reductase activating protein
MNYIKIDKTSISNGPGFRVVLWCAGCTLQCKGCQNPQAQDFNAGKPFDEDVKKFLFKQLNKPYIKGITFSGGHPLESFPEVFALCKEIKEKFPIKDIWLYSGYTYDEISKKVMGMILEYVDVLVDGPYIEEQRDITLPFYGSKNQRLIDVKETLKQGQIIQYKIN